MKVEIPVGELFCDLQQSATDLILIEMIEEEAVKKEFEERLSREKDILKRIKEILRERYTDEDIRSLLINGYPRQFNLAKVIGGSL